MKLLKSIDRRIAKFFILLIRGYQYTISPDKGLLSLRLKGRVCMHQPHCSQYSLIVFKRYGFVNGIIKVLDRVLHCTGGMKKIYDPAHYKIVFFSSAPIGVPFLENLFNDNRFQITGVVTQCDKAMGRGLNVCENIIKTVTKNCKKNCEENFIFTPEKINPDKSEEGKKFYERLKSKEPDFIVVIAYGKIIPQSVLDVPKMAAINIHGSLLPKYRGASPIQSTLLNNDKETGITIMKMDVGMDTGNIINTIRFDMPFDRTTKDIINQFQKIGPKFFNDNLRNYGKKMLGEIVQDETKVSYCKKILKEDGLINPFENSLSEIYNKYRAFYLWPKIYFNLNSKRIIIEELKLDEKLFEENKNNVLIIDNKLNEAIIEIKFKPEGKKSMSRKEFKNGYKLGIRN
ncbi:MAG: methionyl-tRNA formyltransferase [Candidatus Absconditabacterales bacterium]